MKRIYELDLLRGVGIISVVIFHFAWNICTAYSLDIINAAWVRVLVNLFAGMLIFVSGASAQLGKNTLKRGAVVFVCGLVVSAVTYFLMPDFFIKFGILHLLGISMLLAALLKKLKISYIPLALVSAVFIIIGVVADKVTVNSPYLFWLGFITKTYRAADHFPIFPWTGVFLAGYAFSAHFYKFKTSPFTKGRYSNNILTMAGRHSLAIYMLHQPLLQLIMYLPFVDTFLTSLFQ